MSGGERERKFNDWLSDSKAILFKVVHAYAFTHADRQDLFQEILVRLWRSMDQFQGESSLSTWVYRIALNTSIDWTRREVRHRNGKRPFDEVQDLLTIEPVDNCDPRLEWLYQQIAKLSDIDRSVMLLLLDGYAYNEIASIVGISQSNVGVKINRIKSSLLTESIETRNNES
jgi:RNA polymerase sigma-70 factor (ECF subfamily)